MKDSLSTPHHPNHQAVIGGPTVHSNQVESAGWRSSWEEEEEEEEEYDDNNVCLYRSIHFTSFHILPWGPEGWLRIGGVEGASSVIMVGKSDIETCPHWQPW